MDLDKPTAVSSPQTLSPTQQLDNMQLQLDQALSSLTLKDEPAEKEIERATQLIKAYLMYNEVGEFQRVMELRHAVSLVHWIGKKIS